MILALAALAALAQTPSLTAKDESPDVIGLGNKSCGDWTVAARAPNGWPRVAYSAWLGGFMSGMNLAGDTTTGNLTTGMDFNGLAAWVDNYCSAQPLENVSSAAVALSIELIKRKKKRR